VLTAARGVLLAGPTVLAFFTGGYFDEARAWAGAVTWVLVVVAIVTVPHAFPSSRSGRLALLGLSLLAAWTLISLTWAPVAGSAYHAGQRVIVYTGGLFAASALLRDRAALRAVEPALAAGALVVIGYGISERLLPGLLHYQRSVTAEGRLEQPLTYWNAMGEVAALGFVLAARLAGDATRGRWLRTAAVAAAVPLAIGLYISFSRGALFAWAAGLLTLLVVAPRREQLRALLMTLAAGALAAAVAAPFKGVTSLSGATGTREQQGLIVLVAVVVLSIGASLAWWRALRQERSAALKLPRHAAAAAVALICAGLAVAIVAGAKERSTAPLSGGAARLTTLQSNRYAYWRVALHAFEDQPLRGVGAGGWAVYWLRYRPITEFATDAHSLPLQTLAELGIIGFVLLAAFIGGVAWASADALRAAPALAAGPIAGCVVYLAHAPLDWDWQMPAVTLIAIALAGALLALADGAIRSQPGASSTAPQRSAALPA
jgi:hypothetical protein